MTDEDRIARIRADHAGPGVGDEDISWLLRALDAAVAELRCSKAFHDLAVLERNAWRAKWESLEERAKSAEARWGYFSEW